ncbi:neuritin [Carcharodon carcharias]|uniref:neuritin n=1 Tax=Carcharodon carcharias TaxID=13397 RepID=UPI001B7ED716|nr:neuritin [Carcharodon carcharias]
MGLTLNGVYLALTLAVQLAYLFHTVRAAGKCDAVFKGFSDCLLKLGDNVANYQQDMDDKQNVKTICAYWNDFHACATTAIADCQDGATDVWEKLKEDSKNLDFEGSLFDLCERNNSADAMVPQCFTLVVLTLSALLTWILI